MDRLADYVNKVVVLDAITGEVVPPPATPIHQVSLAEGETATVGGVHIKVSRIEKDWNGIEYVALHVQKEEE